MASKRGRRLIVGLASMSLIAPSLLVAPVAGAAEDPAAQQSASQPAEPTPSDQPTPSPAPSPDLSPSPTPAPSPSLSPSPEDDNTTETETPSETADPSDSPTSSASPSPTESPEATPSPTTQDSWLECESDNLDCPAAPIVALEEVLAGAVTISWTLGETDSGDNSIAEVLVRIGPMDRELTFDASAGRAEIVDLEPTTDYSITLYAIDGKQLSPASNTLSIRTKVVKKQASAGDVSRLIIDTVSDNDPKGAAEAAAVDLPVDGVAVTTVQDIGNDNVVAELTTGISDADAAEVIADLEKDPRIASVEIDRKVRFAAFPADPPDDTYWANNSLWGLYGQYGVGIASGRSSMNNVWTAGQGDGAVVAVLDTGSTVHPDLNDNYVAGYDFVSASSALTTTCYGRSGATSGDGDYVDTATYGALGWDNNPLDPGDWDNCYDSSWHGTHVAGTVAAVGNNGLGVVGVAPEAKVQPIRVLTYGGGYTSDITTAITWASGGSVSGVPANATPADVINLSLGGTGTCNSFWQDAIDGAVARGSVVVVSAGNSNRDASDFVPANCNNVITVASTTSTGVRSSFSNFGSTVEIAAPGSAIWSTMNSGTTTPSSANYTSYSGTSMAAPHVAGVAALLKAEDDTRTPSQILSLLESSVQAFPTTGSAFDCSTSACGAGLLTAAAAASTAPSITGISPAGGLLAGGQTVTISGYNLTGTTDVTFGGTSGTSISVSSATSLTVTTPSGSAGAVDVVVTTPDGTATSVGGFTYYAAPTLSSLNVTSGTTAGGTAVTLTGTNLISTTDVTFGGSSATIVSRTSTTVSVTTPSGSTGDVDVVVTTLGGSATLANGYEYLALPIISTYSQNQGSAEGGDTVTITGTNLGTTTKVAFGGVDGTVISTTATTVTVITPANSSTLASNSGLVDVAVTNSSGTTTDANAFRFFPVPDATSLSVSSGSTSGNTFVTISGTGFAHTGDRSSEWISVTFGGSSASYALHDSTTVYVYTPARAAGTVDVVVTTPGGSTTLSDAFTFVAPPPTLGGGSGGSSGGGGSSSSGASSGGGGGGGGSQNEITAVSPTNTGAPGTVVAFTGWGLSTTRSVNFNDYPARFRLVNDGHLEVTVPNIPPGVYVVHAVLAPEVGRASYWPGFAVLAPGSAPPPVATAPTTPGGTVSNPVSQTTDPTVDFLAFTGTSATLTKATRTKLQKIAAEQSPVPVQATVVAFTNEKGTRASTRRAERRAQGLAQYLERAGFDGNINITTAPGDTKVQSRGALVMVEPVDATPEETRGVSSILIRLKKGRAAMVDGQVRGADQLPSSLRSSLSLGPNLGLRIYRVDLAEPVSQQDAERIADLLARDPGIAFAEPDSFVSKQVSIRQ